MAEIPEWYFRLGCRSSGKADGRNTRMVFSTWLPFIRKSGWQKYPNGIFDLVAVQPEIRMAEMPGKAIST
jgi:hypothetical protein